MAKGPWPCLALIDHIVFVFVSRPKTLAKDACGPRARASVCAWCGLGQVVVLPSRKAGVVIVSSHQRVCSSLDCFSHLSAVVGVLLLLQLAGVGVGGVVSSSSSSPRASRGLGSAQISSVVFQKQRHGPLQIVVAHLEVPLGLFRGGRGN